MPNRLYNKQVTPKGYKAGGRTGKMGGGMMMKRPMMKKGGVAKKIKERMGKKMGGSLKPVDPKTQKGLSKLPTKVRNKMGYMKEGGKVKGKRNFKNIKEIENYTKQAIASLEGVSDSIKDRKTPMKLQRLKDKFKIKN